MRTGTPTMKVIKSYLPLANYAGRDYLVFMKIKSAEYKSEARKIRMAMLLLLTQIKKEVAPILNTAHAAQDYVDNVFRYRRLRRLPVAA
jgi:hypothetical protein